MNKYTILTKENINKLRSDNNGFNGTIQRYLLQYSDNKNKGWITKIILGEHITLTEDFNKMVSIRNTHLNNSPNKKKNLTASQKLQLLKTPQGIEKLKQLGYRFKLV